MEGMEDRLSQLAMEDIEDRLSQMPNNILCSHILSKLALNETVRSSLLSRRFKSLWTRLPHLKFPYLKYDEKTIDDVLLLHSVPLETLDLHLCLKEGKCCDPDKLWRWIRCAALKRVKGLTLAETVICECEVHPLQLPNSLFSCDSLQQLGLENFEFGEIPSYFGGFKNLMTCTLEHIKLDDYTVDKLLTLCPCVEDLTLCCCTGFKGFKICKSNLRKLSLKLCETLRSLTVRCPQLIDLDLQLVGFDKVELIPIVYEIDIPLCENLSVECVFLPRFLGLTQLRKIVLLCKTQYVRKESKWYHYYPVHTSFPANMLPSLSLLEGFPNLEELYIDTDCFQDRVKQEDMQSLSLEKLKTVYLNVIKFGEKEISVIGRIFSSAPTLRTMGLGFPFCHGNHDNVFMKKLLALKRSSPESSLFIVENEDPEFDCSECGTLEKTQFEVVMSRGKSNWKKQFF